MTMQWLSEWWHVIAIVALGLLWCGVTLVIAITEDD